MAYATNTKSIGAHRDVHNTAAPVRRALQHLHPLAGTWQVEYAARVGRTSLWVATSPSLLAQVRVSGRGKIRVIACEPHAGNAVTRAMRRGDAMRALIG